MGRIMVVKVVKAKVVTCRVGQSETRVPRIAAACRVCRVRRRWETCEQSKRICQLFFPVLGYLGSEAFQERMEEGYGAC